MAFLDNSGDIILDAVLTDTGRQRLAKGDGSFRIAKFAFGDDEIDYGLFVGNTGSAYQDLSILQTPVLEAFTNNSSLMKSTLLSISDENLLYLPILELNEIRSSDVDRHTNGLFTVAVNKETEDKFNASHKVMYGSNPSTRHAEIDQGIDSLDIPATTTLSSDLVETQYLLTLDSRFGSIIGQTSTTAVSPAFIDDDLIANYYITTGTPGGFVTTNTNTNTDATIECILGARGTILRFRILASLDLHGGALFSSLGSTVDMTDNTAGSSSNYKYIDATLGVKGVTTGYRLDLPIRFIRFNTD
tara:strand:+ start:999 stop:1904 length:906 start_codon:yes stop_codon:yes gene_type:complete